MAKKTTKKARQQKVKTTWIIFGLVCLLALLSIFIMVMMQRQRVVNLDKTSNDATTATSYKKLTPGTTWQWQLTGTIDEKILDPSSNKKKMMDVDMEKTSSAVISRLKAKKITVVCYMEIGAWESYRNDSSQFPDSVKGNSLDPPFDDERYLDIRSQTVKNLMLKRLDKAKAKGCQGIEPDIDDAYFEDFEGDYTQTSNYTGFPISYATQKNYNTYLAKAAHSRGMSFGLKNGADAKFIKDLLPVIDWVLTEQCYEYGECSVYKPVIAANKAVFAVEYSGVKTTFCPALNRLNFDGLKKAIELNAKPRTPCRTLH